MQKWIMAACFVAAASAASAQGRPLMRVAPGQLQQQQSTNPAGIAPGAIAGATRYDATAALTQQVNALQQENAALKARLDKLEAKVANLDQGVGQVLTNTLKHNQQINSQAQDIAALSNKVDAVSALPAKLADLDSRFKAHKHTYGRASVGFSNKYFVTSSHMSGDDKDLASYINVDTIVYEPTSAPVN